MVDALEAGVVGVLNPAGEIVGTGFVVADGLVLTCAHVIEVHVEADVGTPSLSVRFHRSGEALPAVPVPDRWRPDGEDVALLQVEGEAPAGVVSLPLGPSAGREGGDFRVLGYPLLGDMVGVWASGRVEGVAPDGEGRERLQLSSANLAQGHSGAPVWDEAAGRVIGVVSEVYLASATGKHRDTAYAIPAETLWRLLPELEPPEPAERGESSPLTPELLSEVRGALGQCGPFDSDAVLRAVFIDARLRPWRDDVPEARSRSERIDAVIDLLHDKESAEGDNALVLLLRVLGERAHPGDACHGRLLDLAERAGSVGNPRPGG